ncbi:SRPBCC domain-containing protein [Devosia sp. 63-57]|uniref:SRPBCC family protein n=1 Tax=Devosia sp. 63-57 TaxID=1895751 RepID=UPI00086E07BD|nr:SRPBCC domain-containing protein [Devosia sp. 63-57]ODT49879.1 MAG: hypothetical protein ABS74_06735 [Pelagibacterium sp. SCN 63-126]ODU85917.1 MAG: hypothetical protein ABT14_11085 [Pelagibacterium sp. SCN 63-17]OJX45254.1 MAG: hypothetical protein BGO80_05385 [Devosia sp. 63-57]
MTDADDMLVFETTLDAPPEKVWRALTIPEYLERWLQPPADTALDVIASEENRRVSYRWREPAPVDGPAIEDSVVTFELTPQEDGRTGFRLTHAPMAVPAAANSNDSVALMLRAA